MPYFVLAPLVSAQFMDTLAPGVTRGVIHYEDECSTAPSLVSLTPHQKGNRMTDALCSAQVSTG